MKVHFKTKKEAEQFKQNAPDETNWVIHKRKDYQGKYPWEAEKTNS